MVRQAELIRQAQDGDKKARDKVVSDNLGLVHAIVRRFEKRGHDREELFQIGCIGLKITVPILICTENFTSLNTLTSKIIGMTST
jgi:DNA-directed RNA polymerase specialized sigma subunit